MTALSTSNNLFVYGTLRNDPSHEMFHTLARAARYLGEGRARGELYDLGSYPGLLLAGRSSSLVAGEVYALDPELAKETWDVLDRYEGCTPNEPEPHEYKRKLLQVNLSDGREVEAWAYVLNVLPSEAVYIPGGDYMVWRRLLQEI